MADIKVGLSEENATEDSVYGAYMAAKARGMNTPTGYGSIPRIMSDPPDSDPLGVSSTTAAESGQAPLTSNTVMGLYLKDNSWATRDELMQTEHGRKLVQAEEDVRRGHKRGFFDTLFGGPVTDLIPFYGMFAKVGGSMADAGEVNDAYDKLTRNEKITRDQAIKVSLYDRENVLNSDQGFGTMFAGIVRQAPAFFAEFGMLGKVGQVARSAYAARVTGVATDAAAKSASRWALSQATKIGADEYAEMAVRSYADAAMKGTTKSFATAVRELAENPTLRKQTVDAVAANVEGLVDGAANSVARVDRWAPGLAQKVARVRAETALDSALSRMSSDSRWVRFWNGLKKSTADSAVSGLTDLGSWGTEAGSVINTGYASAGKAAIDAITGLTVGAAARGSALYLPRTAVTSAISSATGAVGAQTLALKSAAYENDDDELMSRAEKMGMFLDWMEYVSENTGRGFNGLFRAAGLKLFPKLMSPATRVAGTTHITGAKLTKDAAGAVTGVEYVGLVEAGKRAEVGGAIRRFAEKRFGGKALREDVANDQFRAVSAKLSEKGVRVSNPAALQATLSEGKVQPGLSDEIAAELGADVRAYTRDAVKAANRAGIEGMKIRGFQMYYIADFMARHNLDPVSTMDAFAQMGYDGIVGEMLEERYSDVVTALAGANAEQKQGFFDRLGRATRDAFMVDDNGKFKWNQFVAEAAGFAVPLVARGMIMRGLSTIGSPNRWQKHRDWSASYADATRYGLGIQWKLGDFLEAHEKGVQRFSEMASDARNKYSQLKESGTTADGTPVDQATLDSYLDTERRARTAVRRLSDIKKSFIESLTPAERADSEAIVNAPMVTDTDLMSPEEAYNLRTRPGDGEMRQAMAAYRTLVDNAAESGQLLYQSNRKTKEEDGGWFRRVSRQVGEATLRLAGTAVTGDIGFMSVNPARWTGNDLGMPDDVQTALEKGYGKIFEAELRADQSARANARTEIRPDGTTNDLGEPSQADYDRAHERALAKFQPIARQMMTDLLARHQTRMFSHEEMRDIAMTEVARDMGYAPDVATREFVDVNGNRVSFDDFVARDGVEDKIRANVIEDSKELYRALTEGLGAKRMLERSEDGAVTIADTLTIPKDLPTARQAVLARVLRSVPALRTVMMSVEADPNRSIDDQLGGMATKAEWLQAISSTVVPGGTISSSADLEEAYTRINEVEPAILESVARDLGYTFDGTPDGLAKRNRRIARQAILATASADPDVRIFTRMSTLEERDDRFGSAYGFFAPARRLSNGKWTTVVFRKGSSRQEPVEAGSPEQLAEILARPEYGYSEAKPKLVYTSARVLQSSDALTMIRSLNLGTYYRERMRQNATDNDYLDPLLRVKEDGVTPLCATESEADSMRERERNLSDLFEARGKQLDPALYLREGESATDAEAMKRANLLMLDAKACWYRRNGRNDRGEAQGYVATADDLLRQYQVTVPNSAEGNAFGTALQSLRGKYSINIRAIRDVGATGNVYVPINHGSAQDYESALLEGALLNAYARNRSYIDGAFDSTLRDFMDDASRVMLSVEDAVRRNGNEGLADKIEVLRNATVARSQDQVRKPSPTTFALFASAFSLYRTEVPKSQLNTVLGTHAAALAAIAPQIRKLTSFIGFTSVVDRVLGGAGFETELLNAQDGDALLGRGILRMYALFAPEGSKTLAQRIAESVPSGSYEKFVEKAAALMNAAARPRFIQKFSRPSRKAEAPLDVVKVVTAVAEETGMTPPEVISAIRATEDAGDTPPTVPPPVPPKPKRTTDSGIAVGEDDDEDDISIVHEDDNYAMGSAEAVPAVDGLVVAPAVRDNLALLPSEVNSLVDTFTSLAAAQDGALPDPSGFEAIVRKLIPDVRDVDMKAFLERFNAKRDKNQVESIWGDEPDNEEGVLPDGHDGNNSRAVEMLKSKALSNFLAMMNLVSPSTGRDFQPFVEDMRSLVAASSYINPDMGADLAEATEFLRQILNPRSETSVDNAPGRDSIWRHRIQRLDPKNPGFADVRRYVRAFLGSQGSPAVNARAALFLTYLSSIPQNVRMQMASLVASSAPASPLRVSLSFRSDERGASVPVFLASPVSRKGGHTSMGTITSSFGRFQNRDARFVNKAADDLEAAFARAAEAGELSNSLPLFGRERGIFNTYARILAPVFGADSPLVSMLVSRSMSSKLRSDYRDAQSRGNAADSEYVRLVGFFASADGTVPSTARSLVETLRSIAATVSAGKENGRTVADLATELFQSGPRSERNIYGAATSLQGGGVWHMLMRAYSDAKPVTVMNAETDPERTSRPASSLAITMCGIEPALQEFLDRKDKSGFRAVLRDWFPAMAKLSDSEFDKTVADYRQRLMWPSLRGDSIVAKSISKSARATETLAGCRTAYEYETGAAPQGYVRRNLVFVPVYSGDHSSSILIQVPLAKEFAAKNMTYDKVAEMVSSWVGLDLLGTDAKRSAVTCLEAPGTSMFDYVYNEDGSVMTDDAGKPVQGHAYVSIVWNSDPTANNEAMIGTTGIVGYGATRQQEMSKNPGSRTVKCHIAAVGEDEAYGPALTLIKSLAVVKGSIGTRRGEFVVGSPLEFLEKHALGLIKGQEDVSTVTYTDFDSVKLGVANSKTIFAGYDENGDPVPLMQYVFGKVRDILDGKVFDEAGNKVELGTTVTTAELDKYVGKIEWTNLGGSGKKGRFLLSQLLPGVRLDEVRREGDFGGHRMFSLTYQADSQMAFQVANVSHDAQTDRGHGRTPRNYMLDSLAMARVLRTWNADEAAGLGDASVFGNAEGVCSGIRDLVSAWGFVSSAISVHGESIDNILADDEEYLDLLAHGEPENGDYASDYRMRAFASWAKKNNLNVPINGIDAPLVTNAGWIDDNGEAQTHSASRMFRDTLRGARTIAKSDRTFWRGHKRSAICNVNCNDISFRYGMYVEEADLLAAFPDVVATAKSEEGELSGTKLVAAVLDRVITKIQDDRDAEITGSDTEEKLARCLVDHHGVRYSDRSRTVRRKQRGSDGALLRDAEGNVIVAEEERKLYSDVSFLDLFTRATRSDGRREFDRTSVYDGMYNDATKRTHVYLGGTMMGLPRTPSYNGSMWLQTVRAGLPVTENWNEESKQWTSGRDAMVSPDPFSLAILGCDHDGDKTKLYMLMPGKDTDDQLRTDDLLAAGIDRIIAQTGVLSPGFSSLDAAGTEELRAFVKLLADRGIVEFDSRPQKNDDGTTDRIPLGIRLTQASRRAINNIFVNGLFDMNRMLPVMDDAEGKPFYTGPVSDGDTNRGAAARMTKATPAPKAKQGARTQKASWDSVKSSLGPKVLDAEKGGIIGNPTVAAEVQTGAGVAAEARAIIVSMASALHFAYMSGMPVGPFNGREVSAADWLDFMYHVDGLSNMTFDDIKEQICGRLGVTPEMIETLIADIINSAPAGKLPTTDTEFMDAIRRYGSEINRKGSPRNLMARASDPADYAFRQEWYEKVTGAAYAAKELPTERQVRTFLGLKPYGRIVLGDAPTQGFAKEVHDWAVANDRGRDYAKIMRAAVRAGTQLKQPMNGMVMSVLDGGATVSDLAEWFFTVSQLKEAKAFGNALNYMHVDPASNTSASEADRLAETIDFADLEQIEGIDASDLTSLRRMRAGTAIMYGSGAGEVIAARGLRDRREFASNRAALVSRFAKAEIPDGRTTREALLVSSLYAAPLVAEGDAMALEANEQSVGWALAAFRSVPYVPGSKITSANAYEVVEAIAREFAKVRHPDTAGTNVTLDACYGIEAMTDVVARFVTDMTVHGELPIFDYLREVPNANAWNYTPDAYGPAAEGLSRIVLSMANVSEGQIAHVKSLFARVIAGELDGERKLVCNAVSDGLRGSFETDAEGHRHYVPKGLRFTLSVENLKAMKAFASHQTTKVKPSAKQAKEGTVRDLDKTIDQLISVFTGLETRFGRGFSIEPSALVGQLIPLYSAITERTTGTPDATTSMLTTVMPGVYQSWARELASMRSSADKAGFVSMATAVDYSPAVVAADDVQELSDDVLRVDRTKATKSLRSKSKVGGAISVQVPQLHYLAKAMQETDDKGRPTQRAVLAERQFRTISRKAAYGTEYSENVSDPRFRHTLSIFDGVRGVVFRNTLAAVSGQLAEGFAATKQNPVKELQSQREAPKPEPAVRTVDVAPAVVEAAPAPVAVAPAERKPEEPKPIRPDGYDEHVADVAARMDAVVKMWNCGRVEYAGGNKFTVVGKLNVVGSSEPYETRVEVEVKPDGEQLLSDAEIRERIKGKLYRQSLANASGKTEAELDAMDADSLFELAKQYRPTGRSRTFMPGTSSGTMTEVGEWRLSADMIGVLTGKIELVRNEKDPAVVYHEYFHSVMGFMRTLGAFSEDDVKQLVKRYGASAKYGKSWFNEEKAADDFKAFAEGKLDVTEKEDSIWSKVFDFLSDLMDILFYSSGKPGAEAYGNEMKESPLAYLMLTGCQVGTTPVERLDFEGKVSRACASRFRNCANLRKELDALPPKDPRRTALLENLNGTMFTGVEQGFEYQIGEYLRLIDEDGSGLLPKIDKPGNRFHMNVNPGDSILDSENPLEMTYTDAMYTREYMILQYAGRDLLTLDDADPGAERLVRFGRFLNRLSVIGREGERYGELMGEEAMRKARREAVAALVKEYGQEGRAFADAYRKFMSDFGPSETVPAESPAEQVAQSASVTETVPNSDTEGSIDELMKSMPIVIEESGDDFDPSHFGLDDDSAYAMASVHPSLRETLRTVAPDRMNVPYPKMNALAREIGRTIRSGMAGVSAPISRCTKECYETRENAVAMAAVRQVGSLYGVDVSKDTEVRRALFRAVHELHGMVQADVETAAGGEVKHAASHKGDSSETARDVSPAVMSAAIATSTGVRPRDMALAAIERIDDLVKSRRYSRTSTFVLNVVNPAKSVLRRLASADPTHLVEDAGYREDMIGGAVSKIRSGLLGGRLSTDGSWSDFILVNVNATENGDSRDNVQRYADHISNPDFHAVIHAALDAVHMVGGAMRYCRTIGFEPGSPEDTMFLKGLDPNMPEPLTLADMAASDAVAPEQMQDPAFDFAEASYFDQPYFTARHPEEWLDSVLRPQFGTVNIREHFMEERRAIAGFHTRSVQQGNLDARMYGLDVQPGQAVTAIDSDYESQFEMKAGKVVKRGRGKSGYKFSGYAGEKALGSDGKPVVMTLADCRRSDLLLKARKCWAQGGKFVLTGVDGLTFAPTDSSDPSHYEWEKVKEREEAGIAGGYSDLDRVLVRLHRQFSDDLVEPWNDIIGPDGLNMYDRIVKSACSALAEAKRLMSVLGDDGKPVLNAREVNDFVLRRMDNAGVVASVEAFVPGIGRTARTVATVKLSVDEIETMFRNSSTYRKLLKAGRTENMLSRDSYVKPHMDLFREVKEFVAAHPYLSDGDGAFFHNVSTPLPFVQGSGFFMYAANRVERDSQAAVSEAMTVWEKAFYDLVGTEGMTPATSATADQLRLMRTLFHLNESDSEAVRSALQEGRYENVEGLRLSNASTVRDMGLAIYNRLVGMTWKKDGDPVLESLGGHGKVARMLKFFEKNRGADQSVVAGGVGMTDELVYRMSGTLPANHQLGHAVQNAIDGITNGFAFRAALINMLTTPDEEGMPVCYARPSDNAEDTGGVPDQVWGTVARWWAQMHKLDYDPAQTGVQNARRIYDAVHDAMQDGRIEGKKFGSLKDEEIDARSIQAFMARAVTPEEESKLGFLAGGYAMGYAKHLFQSSRGLGPAWVRKSIHRAWAYSKGLSVSFSYFFPLATRFESPVGAVGALATLGGNFSAEAMRKYADTFSKLQSIFRGKGWITKDFLGQRDVMDMLDSNDPFLAELYHWAGCLGISLSDSQVNPQEHSRGMMQEDLKNVVAYVRKTMGTKAAAQVDSIMKALLTRSGDRAFTYHLNATKLAVTAQICARLQIEAAKAGKAFDPVRDLKRYSGYINAEIGGIDPLRYAWAHPGARNLMNAMFFSWEWTRGAWEAGGGTVLEQILFGGHDVTAQERKYLIGRAARMGLEVMFGLPMTLQVMSKAIGMALVAGMDPDDPELTEEQRRRLTMVRDTPWFTWQNEDKTWMTAFDITPIMAGVAARFPEFAKSRANHALLYGLGALGAMATPGRGLALKALKTAGIVGMTPVYTGTDAANQKTRGRRYYQHFGKQGWEFLRWFTDPVGQFMSKLSMPVQRLAEGVLGRSLSWMDHPSPWDDQGQVERWINPTWNSAWFNMTRAFLPFSVSSLVDVGDAGFLPLFGPVQMGRSSSTAIEDISKRLDRWASDDRRGYAFGGMSRKANQKFSRVSARRDVEIAHILAEARANGYSEADAYELVDSGLRKLTSSLYGQILEEMPTTVDGDFDEDRLGKLLRKANRLGRYRKDMYEALMNRMKMQNRWKDVSVEARARINAILRASKATPYKPLKEALKENGYDY